MGCYNWLWRIVIALRSHNLYYCRKLYGSNRGVRVTVMKLPTACVSALPDHLVPTRLAIQLRNITPKRGSWDCTGAFRRAYLQRKTVRPSQRKISRNEYLGCLFQQESWQFLYVTSNQSLALHVTLGNPTGVALPLQLDPYRLRQ